jgi:hypothetical protein
MILIDACPKKAKTLKILQNCRIESLIMGSIKVEGHGH